MQELTRNPIPDDMTFDDIEAVMVYTGMSRTGVYALIKNDDFPQPYQFGRRAARWKRTEVLEWMNNRPRGTRLTPMQRKAAA